MGVPRAGGVPLNGFVESLPADTASGPVSEAASSSSIKIFSSNRNFSKDGQFSGSRIPTERKVQPMHTSDRFLRFAAECQVMAKLTRSAENKVVWRGLAERWIRCAELVDQHEWDRNFAKRHTRTKYSSTH